ncbi:MAG: chromosomal replication initiator protein DnaA [Deltaproteobacteria bacterium]|nr:chromosomal replication initiator protein DnaA [Deltaproteobacteria bacterium]
MNQLWEQVLENIRSRIPPQGFRTWIEPTKVLTVTDAQVELGVPTIFYEQWFHDNYLSLIKSALKELTGRPYEIVFKVGAVKEPNLVETASGNIPQNSTSLASAVAHESQGLGLSAQKFIPHLEMKSFAGDVLNPKYTFETFVVGASNQFSHAAAYAAAEQPGGSYNPLFIFGGVGLGKTHLLNAIGNHILNKNPALRICYISSERFMNELINCLRYEKMPDFRKKYRDQCDVLLMDDIQFLAGKDRTQDEFFHTFNTLHGARKQIVVSSDKFPKEIQGLEERLRTRFEWGLIADIQAPEIETRIAILRNKAEMDDIYLPDEVAIFLASHIKSNVRELEGSLIRLGAYSSLTGMEVSVELAKEVLKNLVQQKQLSVSLDEIQKHVASFYNVNIGDLKSKKKLKILSHPRQVAMYLCRKYTEKSFPEIGKYFGGKDHSTVMHAVRKISDLMEKDLVFRKDLESIERMVETAISG